MPVDFDDQDLEDVLGGGEAAAEPEPAFDEADVEDQMSEAEARLEVAQYYKLLLNQDLFDNGGPAAGQVQQEMRQFARQRLAALLGVPMKSSGLSDGEAQRLRVLASEEVVTVLVELASRLLKKPSLMGTARKQLQEAPATPAAAPVAPKKVKAPSLRKVATPAAKATPAKQAANVVRTPVQEPQPTVEPESLIPEDQVVEGPHVKSRRGKQKQIVKTIVGADGKEIEMNLTKQTMTPPEIAHLRKPAISTEQYNMISAQHATEALRDLDSKLRGK